jgi:hypothetical protein
LSWPVKEHRERRDRVFFLRQKTTTLNRRQENIVAGAMELRQWLLDTAQLGLAERYGQDPSYWQSLAARLVDAQAGGLANRVRKLGNSFSEPDWQEQVLNQIGELYLITEAFRRVENLPPPLQEDMWALAGVGIPKKTLLSQPGLWDHWAILGQKVSLETRLDTRRTWLYSAEHQRFCLLLEFAVGKRDFEFRGKVGQAVETEMVFYPGAHPLRAWHHPSVQFYPSFSPPRQYQSHAEMLDAYSKALAQNPFLPQFPALHHSVVPLSQKGEWFLLDKAQKMLPLNKRFGQNWKLLAASGGKAISVFGEWNGLTFLPLGMQDQDLWIKL